MEVYLHIIFDSFIYAWRLKSDGTTDDRSIVAVEDLDM